MIGGRKGFVVGIIGFSQLALGLQGLRRSFGVQGSGSSGLQGSIETTLAKV